MRQLRFNFSGQKTNPTPPAQRKLRSKRSCKLNIPLFYELTRDANLSPTNPMANIGRKRDILARCNYPRLIVSRDGGMSVYTVRWERIGRAFADIYMRVQKKYANA